ncbi:BON domain-containing protein [Aureimonas sp. Leaf324]|uniref:BON domain-containing protein n=1 Tax=Aureimonas sp. Leaf324 TaxID=1736336 RepID=UPI0006F5BE05|nr:BON domain-containing protein [Aureimonas sp. Leaf324]KQQ79752.1 hypothetical protein ASF65_12015 [Aureimonas sp. Leaf324]
MSDYRNFGDRNRSRNDDERYGSLNERDARRRAAYGERDAYGEWDRDNYGQNTETGYGRERANADRYGSYSRNSSQSSFGGAYDDRFERNDGYRDQRSSYGPSRYAGRNDYGQTSSYDDYGNRDRYRQSSGYGRDYSSDRGYGYGSSSYNAARDEDRGFFERAGDEIASWFGDRDAERRREADKQFGGRGPKGYTRSDERIRDDVNDRLTDDHYIDASDIEVTVKDREVTLAGHVPTRNQKRRAEDLVERISGVSYVQNNLRVETGSGGLFGTSSATATSTTGSTSTTGEVGGPRGWSTDTTVKTIS